MSKTIPGIKDVLGGYVTTQPIPAVQDAPTQPKTLQSKIPTRKRARLGRPPGKSSNDSPAKEKATLRISTELMSEYRDWSWDERCQLGELVERALADYRRRHR
jgi:uncharacterized protein (DUF4415 family)